MRSPPAWTRTARRLGGARINSGDFGDLRALTALPDPNRQRRARLKRAMAREFNDADVKESFAGPVGQFDKPEALFTIEPLHLRLPFRSAWHGTGGLTRRTIH